MITPDNTAQLINGKWIRPVTLWGSSTDVKPTEDVANGSIFVEMDTSTVYTFDYGNTEWQPWGGGE